MPKVSVLMTNYNGWMYIAEAIESILWQTFTDFELIIVDDGSSDESWEIIQKYAENDGRIRCYKNEKNSGISVTRNRLIDLAQWEYFAWLDSDDRAKPERLKKQVKFLEKNPWYGIIGSWMMLIDTEGKEKGVKQLPISDQEIRKQWYMRNSLNHPTLMMTRECIKKLVSMIAIWMGQKIMTFEYEQGCIFHFSTYQKFSQNIEFTPAMLP